MKWAGAAIFAAACSLALFATAYTPLNTDLGWMLDFGRTAARLGHLPATNGRSFMEPDHPLILHEWASCLAFYFVHAHWGAVGLIALRWLSVIALMAIVVATIRRTVTSPLAQLIAALITTQALGSAGGLQLVRPQLASWILLAAIIHIALYGGRRALWCCPALFALWANLHGGWLAGACALWVACGGRGIEQRIGWRERDVPDDTLMFAPVVAPFFLLANPYGFGLIKHTLHHVSDDVRLLNHEWTPLIHARPLSPFEQWSLASLVAAVALVAATVSYRRVALWLLMLFGVALALSANRNVRVAPLFMAPALAAALGRVVAAMKQDRIARAVPLLASVITLAFIAPLAMEGRRLFDLVDYRGPNPGTSLSIMRENHIAGRVWSDFNWGGTILWALPDAQVACDGRNVAAYSEHALRDCMLFGDAADPVAVMEKYGADTALFPIDYPRLGEVARHYPIIHCDADACILSRKPELEDHPLAKPSRPVLASELFR